MHPIFSVMKVFLAFPFTRKMLIPSEAFSSLCLTTGLPRNPQNGSFKSSKALIKRRLCGSVLNAYMYTDSCTIHDSPVKRGPLLAVHFIAKPMVRFSPEAGEVWGGGRGAGPLRHARAEHFFWAERNSLFRTWSIRPTTPSALSRLLVGSSARRPGQAAHDLRNPVAAQPLYTGAGGEGGTGRRSRGQGTPRQGRWSTACWNCRARAPRASVRLGGEEARALMAAWAPRCCAAGPDPRQVSSQEEGPFSFLIKRGSDTWPLDVGHPGSSWAARSPAQPSLASGAERQEKEPGEFL